MITLDKYRSLLVKDGATVGNARKEQSSAIIEATWWDDVSAKHAYIYDYYHDDKPLEMYNLKPWKAKGKTPIDIKYIIDASQTFSKDQVTYHIQLKPSQECNVDYYKEMFERYDAKFPVGLYIDIPNEKGVYNKWLIVDIANFYDTMVPTFQVLPCNKIIQYIYGNKKYQIASVLRSQNSYNSGIWRDRVQTIVEDQQKFIVPLNDETELLFYDQRMIIDNFVKTEPRAWRISKVNRLSSFGCCLITLAQNKFNEHTDYIEYDDSGNIIGMWADYYKSDITPTDWEQEKTKTLTITHAGLLPEIKVGGSYKKFIVTSNEEENVEGVWSYEIDSEDASELVKTMELPEGIKIKFLGDDSYLDKNLTITFTSVDGISASIDVDIVSL